MSLLTRRAAVILIGPMGAGKSEVGRRLAHLLGRKFRDTDRMVERAEGRSVAEIFEQDGETVFRAMESAAVKRAVESEGAVVACGGGAVLDPSNVAAVRSAGVVVYLKPTLEAAAARVRSGERRPLLKGGDVPSKLSELLVQRDPYYREAADHVVEANGTAAEVTAAVLTAMGKQEAAAQADPVGRA